MNKKYLLFVLSLLLLFLFSCHCPEDPKVKDLDRGIISVASSNEQWTGVAVSADGRIFSNFPNWSDKHTKSVIEVTDTTDFKVYPNADWNTWKGSDPENHFICVQSVYMDDNNFLWVLDAANPQRQGEYQGVVPGGAKLVKIDLGTNAVIQKIIFTEPVIRPQSYLNDVRVDSERNTAYISDSNTGAIIVVNLSTGNARRLLDADPSTKSENTIIVIDNKDYRKPNGEYPIVHVDGIALTPDKQYLYWRALTGKSIFKIDVNFLNDESLTPSELSGKIKRVASYIEPSDGIIFVPDGTLYFTSIEEHAIGAFREGQETWLVKKSPALQWPDSFSSGPDGYIYVTTSQINIPNPTEPYRIYKFKFGAKEN